MNQLLLLDYSEHFTRLFLDIDQYIFYFIIFSRVMLKFLHLFAVFRIVSFAIVQEYGKPLKIILLFIAI